MIQPLEIIDVIAEEIIGPCYTEQVNNNVHILNLPALLPANPCLWTSLSALLCGVLRACCVWCDQYGDINTNMAGCNSRSLSRVSLEHKDPQDFPGHRDPLEPQAWMELAVHRWVQFVAWRCEKQNM